MALTNNHKRYQFDNLKADTLTDLVIKCLKTSLNYPPLAKVFNFELGERSSV